MRVEMQPADTFTKVYEKYPLAPLTAPRLFVCLFVVGAYLVSI